jgi:hypothetical protein
MAARPDRSRWNDGKADDGRRDFGSAIHEASGPSIQKNPERFVPVLMLPSSSEIVPKDL